jgi:hypothetical protein
MSKCDSFSSLSIGFFIKNKKYTSIYIFISKIYISILPSTFQILHFTDTWNWKSVHPSAAIQRLLDARGSAYYRTCTARAIAAMRHDPCCWRWGRILCVCAVQADERGLGQTNAATARTPLSPLQSTLTARDCHGEEISLPRLEPNLTLLFFSL